MLNQIYKNQNTLEEIFNPLTGNESSIKEMSRWITLKMTFLNWTLRHLNVCKVQWRRNMHHIILSQYRKHATEQNFIKPWLSTFDMNLNQCIKIYFILKRVLYERSKMTKGCINFYLKLIRKMIRITKTAKFLILFLIAIIKYS